ncbi:hypothetical protein L506_1326 [Bordetella bronchiseptica GA96-01]|nr:hypothetical protein L572_1362 [Bordetella bronchiseptica 345]KDC37898.1 hypothetical protein L506_1326 [Bordetella bronchiseptica GA96-01]
MDRPWRREEAAAGPARGRRLVLARAAPSLAFDFTPADASRVVPIY